MGMLSLNTMEDIISKSKEYYSIYLDIEWDADVLSADSFIEITRSGMKVQFQNAIMKPYEQMLIGNGISETPVPSPIPAPIAPPKKPTPFDLPLENMGNPKQCNQCLTECQGDCDSDDDCKGTVLESKRLDHSHSSRLLR